MDTDRDITLACTACRSQFVWTSAEQREARLRYWWPRRGGERDRPLRCADCRDVQRRIHAERRRT